DLVARTGAPPPAGVPAAAFLMAVVHERQTRDATRAFHSAGGSGFGPAPAAVTGPAPVPVPAMPAMPMPVPGAAPVAAPYAAPAPVGPVEAPRAGGFAPPA
ncbi:RDD family protein, partial [Streptomyces sp. NPDC059949]